MDSPYNSYKKTDDLFSHRPLKSNDPFSAIVSSPLPSSLPSNVVSPVFFANSTTKKNIIHPMDGVTRGGPPPSPSDFTASGLLGHQLKL